MVLTIKEFLAMSGVLIFGGVTTVSENNYLQFTTMNFPGYTGKIVSFNYPWFGNFLMFLAMSCVGFLWIYDRVKDKNPPTKAYYASACRKLSADPWVCLIGSSVCDLFASGLMSIGLHLGVSPSVYEILNGAVILTTPVLSFFFLRRKVTLEQGIGMIIVVIGLMTVATSSYLVQRFFSEGSQDDSHYAASIQSVLIGISLILVAQVIFGAEFVLEEYTMQRLCCYPSQVVCIEGIYGFVLTTCFIMPIFDLTGLENDFDAFVFVGAEPGILLPIALFFLTVGLYNAFGEEVTKLISANHRTIIEGLRGLVVWIFSLIERAIFGGVQGEGFYSWASVVEIVGFVIELVGSCVFYGIIRLPKRAGGEGTPSEPTDDAKYQEVGRDAAVTEDMLD